MSVKGSLVVTRTLSQTQAATRSRLLDAGIELARTGGYDAVGMRPVAERAGVSVPTAYQYFSSKDHLLVDVMVERVVSTTMAVKSRPSRGTTPVDRAIATLRRALRRVDAEPDLYVALMRAYISGAPEVVHARSSMENTVRDWVDAALASAVLDDRDAITEILASVLFTSMVGLVTGHTRTGQVVDQLERTARFLLKDVPD